VFVASFLLRPPPPSFIHPTNHNLTHFPIANIFSFHPSVNFFHDSITYQMATIYIGNLTWGVTDETLSELTNEYGATTATVVMGRNGRSRGYGLVQFNTKESADTCMQKLNGFEFEGRELHCKFDEGGANKGGKGGTNTSNPTENASFTGKSLYVSNLPWATDDAALEELFLAHNPVSVAVKYSNDKRSRGWATITFQTPEAATGAMDALTGFMIDERAMSIRLDYRA